MSIPDGWLDFSPYGVPIQNTRIIATKSPMKQEFNLKAKAFTPTQLVESLRQSGFILGQVIDLTFTDRYYSSQEFRRLGVTHIKIKVPGKDIPGDDIFAQFSAALGKFLNDRTKEGQLVAVHCTHGINRTGYLLCRYLVENYSMDVNSAITAFNQARGHNIENEEYIANLKRIYSGKQYLSSQSRGASASHREAKKPSGSQPSHHHRGEHSSGHAHYKAPHHSYPQDDQELDYPSYDD